MSVNNTIGQQHQDQDLPQLERRRKDESLLDEGQTAGESGAGAAQPSKDALKQELDLFSMMMMVWWW